MDGIQLTFDPLLPVATGDYEITPAPTPTPKVKINPPARLNGRGVNNILPDPALAADSRNCRPPSNPSHAWSTTAPPALSAIELLTIIVGFDSIEEANARTDQQRQPRPVWPAGPSMICVTVRGICPTRAARIKAACGNLAAGCSSPCRAEKSTIKAPADAANLLMLEMGNRWSRNTWSS